MAALGNSSLEQQQHPVEQMFWAHHQRILRAVYRITGNMADAEDVAQSVFTRLLKSEQLRIDSAGSYLYRAAVNGALDLVRSRQRGREVSLELAGDVPSLVPTTSPERQLSSGELRDTLRTALASLSPRSAEIFVLRYVEGLSNAEIAALVGTSKAVVAVTLHQARTRLKKHFEQQMRGTR